MGPLDAPIAAADRGNDAEAQRRAQRVAARRGQIARREDWARPRGGQSAIRGNTLSVSNANERRLIGAAIR